MDDKQKELQELYSAYNNIAKKADLTNVDPDLDFEPLPEGYMYAEVSNATFGLTKESKLPMVTITFDVIEGYRIATDDELDEGLDELIKLKGVAKRKIFVRFINKDEQSLQRFVKNMLKFEDKNGEPLLEKEIFMDAEFLSDALACLVGSRLYVQISKSKTSNDEITTWQNLISWKRASQLGLPIE